MTGTSQAVRSARSPVGRFAERDGRWFYEIEHVDAMPPFLMTLVGDTDLWMFLSSAGAFTAGRVEADRCLFPYETDDRLHELSGMSGPATVVRFDDGRLWRPLVSSQEGGAIQRVLRRSVACDRVELEETDEASGLVFRVAYALCDAFGIVRRCSLTAPREAAPIECDILDGYLNIMPAETPLFLQQSMSTLVDGYKRCERISARGPAVYLLESRISDRPEATEALRANAVWRLGLDGATVSLSDEALSVFARGGAPADQRLTLGRRGAYLCASRVSLAPGEQEMWTLVADAHLDHGAVAGLDTLLRTPGELQSHLDRSLQSDAERLARLLDEADGAQESADLAACAAHRCNVLFNAMRGGVPLDGDKTDAATFRAFVRSRHSGIAARCTEFLDGLDSSTTIEALVDKARAAGDPQLQRLALEYLPLTFGRRHGDPSRPWNRFRIRVRDELGARAAGYEGNWRDIFQNWEAMCRSYPAFLPSVIAKFVNASTVDGYNPYRINERGIDWETPEPGNERANIGYWGDHQIVYLLRLLEQSRDTQPDWLPSVLERPVFSYANVPYRILPFEQVAANPRASIVFDDDLHEAMLRRERDVGGDARFVLGEDGEPVLVTLVEKLLVATLAKVSNFVPDGGIWMNTQRPEWNDANNALAGFGLSMVTLNYLRGFCNFAADLIESAGNGGTPLSSAVASWTQRTVDALRRLLAASANGSLDDTARRTAMTELATIADDARADLYTHGPTSSVEMDRAEVVAFFRTARDLCDRTIRAARRDDGLYESYNVVDLNGPGAGVSHLDVMLEGQVAALSSGLLNAEEACDLVDALFRSPLLREDQRTFLLYPRVDLPPFMRRNAVPDDAIEASTLLARALAAPEAKLLARDAQGVARFHADIHSHDALDDALRALAEMDGWRDLVREGSMGAHDAFERTFRHAQFTGRSGRMHKYEGLGSVYWHMVSKLLLAMQECVFRAKDEGEDPRLVDRLREHYGRIRDGLGFRKSPAAFGAVPHEPYSHTPWNSGAQQPGMTGQVKEGVLGRFGELGIRVRGGCIEFDPVLVDPAELLREGRTMRVRGARAQAIEAPAGSVAGTLCHSPFVLSRGERDGVTIHTTDGSPLAIEGRALPPDLSREIFERSGRITMIEVRLSDWPVLNH